MNNNYEQEMILKEKIEKRERFDTILAYILLGVLLVCIILVLWVKFFRNSDELDAPVDEYVPIYISLEEISTSLNNSTLASNYTSDGASFNSIVSGNAINVTYTKDDVNLNLNMPVVGSELMINIPDNDSDVTTEIYKEIGNIVCMYYDNPEKYCRYTLDNMTEDGLDGIRFDRNENNNTVYINITKSFTVVTEIVFNEVKVMDIMEYDYSLVLSDVKVSNLMIATSDVNVVFNGNITRLTDERNNLSVLVKLYDNDNNLLGENKYEYNEQNMLDSADSFNIEFILNDNLKLEDISKYSIEILR